MFEKVNPSHPDKIANEEIKAYNYLGSRITRSKLLINKLIKFTRPSKKGLFI